MLSYIKGTVINVRDQVITVFVQSLSVGFDITVSRVLARLNQPITLYIHQHWNQEQGPSWYGFETELERAFFVCLIACPGVGPKLALTMLEQASIDQLVCWIQTNDIKPLSALKGIGTKKAEQLVLFLRNKLDEFVAISATQNSPRIGALHQVSQVLESLNYSRPEIQQVLMHIGQEKMDGVPFDVLLRKSLAFLAKKV